MVELVQVHLQVVEVHQYLVLVLQLLLPQVVVLAVTAQLQVEALLAMEQMVVLVAEQVMKVNLVV